LIIIIFLNEYDLKCYRILELQEHFTIKRMRRSSSSMIQRMSKAEQNRQTQMGPKHREKSSDLRRRLKAVVTPTRWRLTAIRAKPRPEMLDRQWWSVAHRRRHVSMSATLWSSSTRYGGSVECRYGKVKVKVKVNVDLYSALSWSHL